MGVNRALRGRWPKGADAQLPSGPSVGHTARDCAIDVIVWREQAGAYVRGAPGPAKPTGYVHAVTLARRSQTALHGRRIFLCGWPARGSKGEMAPVSGAGAQSVADHLQVWTEFPPKRLSELYAFRVS